MQGRPSPLMAWCISPCFRIPPVFSDPAENFQNFTFSQKFFHFHPPKFLMTFFVSGRHHQFPNFPDIFPASIYFLPVSLKLLFLPCFYKFLPCFRKIHVFLHALRAFCFPLLWPWCIYAWHNAHTGHPWLHGNYLRHFHIKYSLLLVIRVICIGFYTICSLPYFIDVTKPQTALQLIITTGPCLD